MIEEISIRDLGVIGEATLPLGPGFTAVTGETGAGKTMVVTALGLLLGERADAQVVRQGRERAVIEGRWLIGSDSPVADRVREAGGELDSADGKSELIVSRTVAQEGRSRASVGGRSTPVALLGEVGEQLVVVHGQSEQLHLKSSAAQRAALDRYAGDELTETLRLYRHAHARWRANREELHRLTEDRERRAAEADDLRRALAEIEGVAPQPGEDAELLARRARLSNTEDLRLAASAAHELISSEDVGGAPDVLGLLDTARRQLDRVTAHDAQLAPIAEGIANVSFLMADLAGELASYRSSLDADAAQELEAVQQRLAEIALLVRKYGPTLDDAIAYLESGSDRLRELDTDSDRIARLSAELADDHRLVAELAERLSLSRSEAAGRLAAAVTAELGALAMPNAQLMVDVQPREEFGEDGRDTVALLLQPHQGAEPRPLNRGASGGELSRIMLALEVVLSAADPVPTFVFDEVDQGVGGAAAIEIGRRLAALANTAQVIVVTHLAQVAAFATNHLRVVKDASGEVTASSVHQLTGEERVAEMARLLSGLPDSASGLAHARELLLLAVAPTPVPTGAPGTAPNDAPSTAPGDPPTNNADPGGER